MGKYKYSDEEQRMNNVLKYQDEQLQELLSDSKNQRNETDAEIEVLENKLKQLGIDVSKVKKIESDSPATKKTMIVPSWDNLCMEAEKVVGTSCEL